MMIGQELHWSAGLLPVFDVETTSAEPSEARIVSASLVLTTPKGAVQPGGYRTIVDPGIEIPDEAAAIHGITTERARAEGVPLCVALTEIITRLQGMHYLGMPLVGMNIRYDWCVLHHEQAREGSQVGIIPPLHLIDPYVLDRGYDKFRKGSRKLADLVVHYGVKLDTENAHDAHWDCLATSEVFRAQVRRYPQLGELATDALQDIQREMYNEWIQSLSRFRVRKGEPPIIEAPWPGWPPRTPQLMEASTI